MKKSFIISFFVFLSALAFGQQKDYAKDKYFQFAYVWHSTNYVTPDGIYEFNNEDDTYKILDRKLLHLDKNGYLYFDDKIIISGINWVNFSLPYSGTYVMKSPFEDGYYHESYKAEYKASSTLTEKNKSGIVTYDAGNLGKFAKETFSHYENLVWNDESIPWVEGEKGYGEGVSIKISTEKPFNYLMILNGYVDIARLDLYKKNSRVKTFKIKDLDNNKEYKFGLEDIVEFQFFYFQDDTRNVELIIEEVYKGDNWNDTCVKAIIPGEYYSNVSLSTDVQMYSLFESKKEIQSRIDYKMSFIEK